MVLYKELDREVKEAIARYVAKKLRKKGYNDSQPMRAWLARIQDLLGEGAIMEKQDRIQTEIEWEPWNSTTRSLFDIMYKDFGLVGVCQEKKALSYYLQTI